MTEQEAARKLACQIRINETLPLAFVQSARGAFGPINAALKGLSGIKVHELPDAGRHKHGQLRKDLEATRERLRKIYTEAANRPDWADYIVRQVRSLKDEFNIKPN